MPASNGMRSNKEITMPKKTNELPSKIQPFEALALLAAILFMHSVATAAHHRLITNFRLESPPIWLLVFPVLAVAYYWSQRKTASTIGIVTLVILAVSGYIWLFGLKINSL